MATDEGCVRLAVGEVVTVKAKPADRHFVVESKLGEGGFSAVYKVKEKSDGALYAMKTESKLDTSQRLKMEVQFLNELSNAVHFCRIYVSARTETYNYVIMTLAGSSIADIRRMLHYPYIFTLWSVLRIAIQTLQGLEEMHNIGYLHRDVKPANFAIGRKEIGEQRKILVLDFGLCRKFRSEDGSLKTPRVTANFRGTTRYAPLNCFFSKELSRKDDIESWLYMIIELTVATGLPWKAMQEKPPVKEAKLHARTDEGKKQLFSGCPRQFIDIFDHCLTLTFTAVPDYAFCYRKLRSPMLKCKPPCDELNEPYDWEVLERLTEPSEE